MNQPPFGPNNNLLQNKLLGLKDYIKKENLIKNFIQHFKFFARAPILFVEKKDGSLQMSINYYKSN